MTPAYDIKDIHYEFNEDEDKSDSRGVMICQRVMQNDSCNEFYTCTFPHRINFITYVARPCVHLITKKKKKTSMEQMGLDDILKGSTVAHVPFSTAVSDVKMSSVRSVLYTNSFLMKCTQQIRSRVI